MGEDLATDLADDDCVGGHLRSLLDDDLTSVSDDTDDTGHLHFVWAASFVYLRVFWQPGSVSNVRNCSGLLLFASQIIFFFLFFIFLPPGPCILPCMLQWTGQGRCCCARLINLHLFRFPYFFTFVTSQSPCTFALTIYHSHSLSLQT